MEDLELLVQLDLVVSQVRLEVKVKLVHKDLLEHQVRLEQQG